MGNKIEKEKGNILFIFRHIQMVKQFCKTVSLYPVVHYLQRLVTQAGPYPAETVRSG